MRLSRRRPTPVLAWAHGALHLLDDLLDGPWPRHPLVGPEHLSKLIRVAGLTRAGARRGAVPLTCMREFVTPSRLGVAAGPKTSAS